MPRNRIVSDTRKRALHCRASPDQTRILFGARVSANETDPRLSGPLPYASLVALSRELRISHSWCGFTAYTFDKLMHIGRHERLHYAMGCCGSGVGMSSYPRLRLGQQVLGLAEGRTAFDGLRLQKRPLYRGKRWFLAPSMRHNR